MLAKLKELQTILEGELHLDRTMRLLYATDASVYREIPLAVAIPKSTKDLKILISFARETNTPLVPRTAGTSLAGQVVGNGIIVDVSKNFTKILELNKEEKWVRVEPGVIRNDLNKFLAQFGLFFGPETSTASRCMIGGMVGNNSCGSHSPLYGTTRDHVLELHTILSDGSEVVFNTIDKTTFDKKCEGNSLENKLYRHFKEMLSNPVHQENIRREFPKPEINRRNTGYAIDVLLESAPFTADKPDFNFAKLLCGSEGTLAFTTEIKLNLVPVPPKEKAVVCIQSNSIDDSMRANIIALKYKPGAVELMDKIIMDCTKENIEHRENRFFVVGDPAAILFAEFERDTREEIELITSTMIKEIEEAGYAYACPIVWGADTAKVWKLREDGLGLLANIPGDDKGVACIEDTAVSTSDLPAYIAEFDQIMKKHGKSSIYYAHAGDGEIHLRPILDLKKSTDRELFYKITDDVATLVKKYRGSMSGEHGDGRVRAPFIKKMIGEENFKLVESVKQVWDPQNIFNPGKIVNPAPMNEFLRYEADIPTPEIKTTLAFTESLGILRMAEKCNGTGVCRRTHLSGGTMCPSYMATRNEKDSTRARANILREYLTNSPKENRFDHEEIKEVLDLCLSCKGCKSDCPSNVDMAAMKSEFLHQYNKANGISFSAKMIGNVAKSNALFSKAPWLYNIPVQLPGFSHLIKKVMGIASQRDLPLLNKYTLRAWFEKNKNTLKRGSHKGKVYFFADEVINYNDVSIGENALRLLYALGYEVMFIKHKESGRPAISKGMLDYAKELANDNVLAFKDIVTEDIPLIGIEPSAILTFRDEYPRLVNSELVEEAKILGTNALLIDEFLEKEIKKGNITSDQFTDKKLEIKLHGHCHQKALSSVNYTKTALSLPQNYTVEVIPSGCCGMSGSFGYDAEHYDVSMQIGELVLFPAVRNAGNAVIAATGTSCRHQIKDGTGVLAKHPVELLLEAIK